MNRKTYKLAFELLENMERFERGVIGRIERYKLATVDLARSAFDPSGYVAAREAEKKAFESLRDWVTSELASREALPDSPPPTPGDE